MNEDGCKLHSSAVKYDRRTTRTIDPHQASAALLILRVKPVTVHIDSLDARDGVQN